MSSLTELIASRIPPELWYPIFWEVARPQDEIPLSENMGSQYRPPGFGALRLSCVCRKWREIAMDYKPLWNNITIAWDMFHMERIEHYYNLAKGMEISLVVGKCIGNDGVVTESNERLREIFKEEKEIKRITCFLSNTYNAGVNSILGILPSAREIYFLRAPSTPQYVHATLPRHHCESIKKLLIDCALVGYATDVKLEEFIVSTSSGISSGYWGSLVHPYIYSGSVGTLQVVSIHGQSYERKTAAFCPNIHTLFMSLQELVDVFLPCYEVPNLKKLEITSSSTPSYKNWCAVGLALGRVNPTNIVCHSMAQGQKELVTFLRDIKTLRTLELRGDSVDPLLESFSGVEFAALESLTIRSYEGSGQSIVDYLRRRRALDKGSTVSEGEYLQVQLKNCISIPRETLVLIRDLNRICE